LSYESTFSFETPSTYFEELHEFWGLIGEYYPEYKEAEKKLKTFWLVLEWNGIWKMLREPDN